MTRRVSRSTRPSISCRAHDSECSRAGEAERIQNLYGLSYFQLVLMGDTRYRSFLSPSYASEFEPDVAFFPVDKLACGIGLEFAFVIPMMAAWRRQRWIHRRRGGS